jgi:RimJ/RimL family protein N-acetyltransferase
VLEGQRQLPVSSANPRSPRQRYGLHMLKAATTHDNMASQKVLAKNGLVPIGPAELSDKPGTWYERVGGYARGCCIRAL